MPRVNRTAAAATRIVVSRGLLTTTVSAVRALDTHAVAAAIAYAGSDLDAATQALADCDRVLDSLCKLVERARIAIASEAAPLTAPPTQAEEVAA